MNFTEIRLTNDDELVLLPFVAKKDSRVFIYKDKRIEMSELEKYIINFSSTNGLYTFTSPISIQDNLKRRFFFATDEFINKLFNDIPINTMGSDPRNFYLGKHVVPKVFIKKLLIRTREKPAEKIWSTSLEAINIQNMDGELLMEIKKINKTLEDLEQNTSGPIMTF